MAYDLKTKATAVSADEFLAGVPNETRRADGQAVCALMAKVTGEAAAMWGPSIVGFGRYSYTYASGHSGQMCQIGFSPRSSSLVLYGVAGGAEALLARLGKHKLGKGCLYINRLADVDETVLGELIARAWARKSPDPPAD